MRLRGIVSELRRRHVFKVAVTYALVAWVIMQIGEVAFPPLGLPDWTLTLVIVLAIAFFPFAMILAWAFDLTPHGVVRTPAANEVARNGAAPSAPPTPIAPSGAAGSSAPLATAAPGVAPEVRRRSVVVLPFRAMGATDGDEYLGDGIGEDLIVRLSKVGELRVISRTSAWQYRDGRAGAREIGDALGVAYILSGTVRRSGDRLRISAELVDASDDDHLWAETYDRDAADLLDVQSEVAGSILDAVGERLSGASVALARPTSAAAAFDAYLHARHDWSRRTAEGLSRSLEGLRRAIEIDPDFLLAHAALADAHITRAIYGEAAPHEAMEEARASADRALAIDPESAEALTARACVSAVYEWDWARAESGFERAIRSGPSYVTSRMWYAMHHLLPLRRFDEAERHLEAAAVLDPLSAPVHVSRAALDHYRGDHAAAAASLESVTASFPEFPLGWMLLGLARVGAGRPEEALPALTRAQELTGGSVETTVALGLGHVARGSVGDARTLRGELEARRERGYVSATRLAQLNAALGERDAALASLRNAVEERASDLVWLDVLRDFDPLRGDPEFGTLRNRVLPAAP